MDRPDHVEAVQGFVREVAATAKALKLYPSSSPIPRESAAAAAAVLQDVFDTLPVLSLGITRDGFSLADADLGRTAVAADLARMLQSHGVAEVSFSPGCDADDISRFLAIVVRDVEAVREEGGIGTAVASSGITCISVSDVQLTVVEGPLAEDGEDVDEFLRRLAHDPEKLAAWLASSSGADPATLQDSLLELARSAGASGMSGLLDALSQAFVAQEPEGRDALLGLALEDGPVRGLAGDMLSRLGAADVADSVCGGLYGQNMLSLSTALTSLPIGERFGAIMSQVKEMLPDYGHGSKELEFLDHMIEVRKSPIPESALPQRDTDYQAVAAKTAVSDHEVAAALEEVAESDEFARKRTVTTLVGLLDQQKDFALYCQTLDSLAGLVPRLIRAGDLTLARSALAEIASREASTDLPWPEVSDKLRQARARATGGTAMRDLLATVAADNHAVSDAHDILAAAGDKAPEKLVEEALQARDFDGMEAADLILGRRMHDILPAMADRVQWYQVAPLAARLAAQAGPRTKSALEALASRPDSQSRRELAKGLAKSGNPAALKPLSTLLRDESGEVAVTAVRALAGSGVTGAAAVVSERLDELDIDGKDFALARDCIAALAHMREREAREALQRLARRRTLIKRGHFAEIQHLARQALEAQKRGGSS
jgi:hypothetical protein